MKDVAVVGVGMTRFGKYPDMGIKDFVREAVNEALLDSGMDKKQIQAAYVGNAAAGAMTGQHMIRGQVTLAPMGIQGIPVDNVENACASGSFAFHLAWAAVATGMHDCVLVVGFEKLYDKDKAKSYLALGIGDRRRGIQDLLPASRSQPRFGRNDPGSRWPATKSIARCLCLSCPTADGAARPYAAALGEAVGQGAQERVAQSEGAISEGSQSRRSIGIGRRQLPTDKNGCVRPGR